MSRDAPDAEFALKKLQKFWKMGTKSMGHPKCLKMGQSSRKPTFGPSPWLLGAATVAAAEHGSGPPHLAFGARGRRKGFEVVSQDEKRRSK